jgi:hypothetical protein
MTQEDRDALMKSAQEVGWRAATLEHIVAWWDNLPADIRADINDLHHGDPRWLERARQLSQLS